MLSKALAINIQDCLQHLDTSRAWSQTSAIQLHATESLNCMQLNHSSVDVPAIRCEQLRKSRDRPRVYWFCSAIGREVFRRAYLSPTIDHYDPQSAVLPSLAARVCGGEATYRGSLGRRLPQLLVGGGKCVQTRAGLLRIR